MNRNLSLIILHHLMLVLGIYIYGFNIWVAIPIFFLSMMWAKLVGSDIMHFYFSHGEYQDSIKSYFYTFLTICTGLGSPISFSANHRQHHKYSDTEKDPHSPAHIGWFRVYFLMFAPQKISPRLIADFARSKFQKKAHKYWFQMHIATIIILALIDPRLLFFVLSPFIIYQFHVISATSVLAHTGGEHKNVPLLSLLCWWGWNHADHHNYSK